MKRIVLIGAIAAACSPHHANEAQPRIQHVAPATTRIEPPPLRSPTEKDFAAALAEFEPGGSASLVPAIRLWAERHAGSDVDDVRRLEGLQRLLQFLDAIAASVEARVHRDPAFEAAVMHRLGEGEGYPTPTEDAMRIVAQYERDGLELRRIDGTLVRVDAALFDRVADAGLSPGAREWLAALRWDAEHTTRMAGDNPSDLVRSIAQWERLIDRGEPWATTARPSARFDVELYLRLCIPADDDQNAGCRIDHRLRDSYAAFVHDHPDSRFAAAVAHFVRGATAQRFELGTEAAIDLVGASLLEIERERPATTATG